MGFFPNVCYSTSGSENIRMIREIAYTLISLQPMIRLECISSMQVLLHSFAQILR